MGPLCKILGPGPPGLMYTVCHNGAQTSSQQDSLPVNVISRRDSLSVTDNGSHSGTPFKAPFVNFARQNLDRTPATSQRKSHAQNFGRMSFGGSFAAGGPTHVRTVPNG